MAYNTDEIVGALHNGRKCIHYNDGDSKKLNMANEKWYYDSSSVLNALESHITVESKDAHVLYKLMQLYDNRAFMR